MEKNNVLKSIIDRKFQIIFLILFSLTLSFSIQSYINQTSKKKITAFNFIPDLQMHDYEIEPEKYDYYIGTERAFVNFSYFDEVFSHVFNKLNIKQDKYISLQNNRIDYYYNFIIHKKILPVEIREVFDYFRDEYYMKYLVLVNGYQKYYLAKFGKEPEISTSLVFPLYQIKNAKLKIEVKKINNKKIIDRRYDRLMEIKYIKKEKKASKKIFFYPEIFVILPLFIYFFYLFVKNYIRQS